MNGNKSDQRRFLSTVLLNISMKENGKRFILDSQNNSQLIGSNWLNRLFFYASVTNNMRQNSNPFIWLRLISFLETTKIMRK